MFTKDSGHSVPSLDPSPYPDLLPSEVTIDEVDTLLGEVDPLKLQVQMVYHLRY